MTFPQLFFIAGVCVTLVSCHAPDTHHPVSTSGATTPITGTKTRTDVTTATAQKEALQKEMAQKQSITRKTLVGSKDDTDRVPIPGTLKTMIAGIYKPDKNNPHLDGQQIEQLTLQKEVFTFTPKATSIFTPDKAGCERLFKTYRFPKLTKSVSIVRSGKNIECLDNKELAGMDSPKTYYTPSNKVPSKNYGYEGKDNEKVNAFLFFGVKVPDFTFSQDDSKIDDVDREGLQEFTLGYGDDVIEHLRGSSYSIHNCYSFRNDFYFPNEDTLTEFYLRIKDGKHIESNTCPLHDGLASLTGSHASRLLAQLGQQLQTAYLDRLFSVELRLHQLVNERISQSIHPLAFSGRWLATFRHDNHIGKPHAVSFAAPVLPYLPPVEQTQTLAFLHDNWAVALMHSLDGRSRAAVISHAPAKTLLLRLGMMTEQNRFLSVDTELLVVDDVAITNSKTTFVTATAGHVLTPKLHVTLSTYAATSQLRLASTSLTNTTLTTSAFELRADWYHGTESKHQTAWALKQPIHIENGWAQHKRVFSMQMSHQQMLSANTLLRFAVEYLPTTYPMTKRMSALAFVHHRF